MYDIISGNFRLSVGYPLGVSVWARNLYDLCHLLY